MEGDKPLASPLQAINKDTPQNRNNPIRKQDFIAFRNSIADA
jgi:hypothetical protein